MMRLHYAAILLLAASVSIFFHALASRAESLPPRAAFAETYRGLSAITGHTPATPSQPSIRGRLIRWLANPDRAATLTGIGVLLVFVECNLPGAILPGASGMLLLLSGIYGLTLLPLHPAAVVLLIAGSACLAISARAPLFDIPALAGTGALIYGFWSLIEPTPAISGVHPALAVCIGLVLGGSASLLGRIAQRARRNKEIHQTVSQTLPE